MISGDDLMTILHGVASRYSDVALATLARLDIEDDLRSLLTRCVHDSPSPAETARRLGDELHRAGQDRNLVNECYRVAFYLGEDWERLAVNPLYARFLANRSGAVLDKWPHYFDFYDRHLAPFRGRAPRVLEIGVFRGGGLSMWQWYFGADASVVGADIDEAAVAAVSGRFPVALGDQEDPDFLRGLHSTYGPFDIVIDDGGHRMGQQIVSAETLFPLLADGGIYLVEDTHTSYWDDHDGGLRRDGTFMEWVKARLDDLHAVHTDGLDLDSTWATHVVGIEVADSLVAIRKRRRPRPFSETSGTSSFLGAARWNEMVAIDLLSTRDAAVAEKEAMAREDDVLRSEIRRLRSENASLSADADSQRHQARQNWEQISAMRATTSWRLTAPLRAVRRLF